MLKVQALTFAYDKTAVLQEVDFEIPVGQQVALMGESGCGKSTLLRLIYGELPFDRGTINWKEHALRGPDYQLLPGAPFMKYLAQDFDLMPFITAEENIRKFLPIHPVDAANQKTEELLELMELTEVRNRKVKTLSGGQQQRVALARVLANPPELLLLDEPFSHIDYFRRNQLRRNLFGYLKSEGITCLYATHDHQDVLPFADQVIILKEGELLDQRETTAIYQQPGRLYTASLLGEANLIPIDILKSYASTTRRIVVYAHELKASSKSGLKVVVETSYFMGGYYSIKGRTEQDTFVFFHAQAPIEPGKEVYLNASLETINKRLPI